MLQVASSSLKGDFSRLNEGSDKGMLREEVGALKFKDETRHIENYIVGHLLNQMSAKESLERHGDRAVKAILK